MHFRAQLPNIEMPANRPPSMTCSVPASRGEGFEPGDKPHDAVEILVDSYAAEHRALLEPDEPIEEGTEVGTWVG